MKKRSLLVFFLLIISGLVFAGGTGEKAGATANFRGVISVKGSEPRTWVALTLENGTELRLEGYLVPELRERYQGKEVSIRGTISEASIIPGMPQTMTPIRIIKE